MKVIESYQSRNYDPFFYLGCTDDVQTILAKLSEINQHFGLVNFGINRSCVNEDFLPHTIIDIYCQTADTGPTFSISFATKIEKSKEAYLAAKGKLLDELDDFMTPIVMEQFKKRFAQGL